MTRAYHDFRARWQGFSKRDMIQFAACFAVGVLLTALICWGLESATSGPAGAPTSGGVMSLFEMF
jgi:hypothetical protein